MVSSVSQPKTKALKVWTEKGLEILGNLIRESREALGISQRDMADLIHERTGFYISNRNLGDIENAKIITTWNRLSAIAAAEFVLHPILKKPLTVEDMVDIASEVLDPYTQVAVDSASTVDELGAIHVALHHHLLENQGQEVMHYHYQVELPPLVEERRILENQVNEIAEAIKVWYSWVTCGGQTCCYKFTQDKAGNITSSKVDNAKCE